MFTTSTGMVGAKASETYRADNAALSTAHDSRFCSDVDLTVAPAVTLTAMDTAMTNRTVKAETTPKDSMSWVRSEN